MSAGAIVGVIAAGSGPALLRARLRAATRPARQAMSGARTMRALETQLPGELLGSDLLGLLSRRVRELLAAPSGANVLTPEREPAVWDAAKSSRKPQDAVAALEGDAREAMWEAGFDRTERRAIADSSGPGADRGAAIWESALLRARSSEWAPQAVQSAIPQWTANPPVPPDRRVPAVPATILDRQLRRYWAAATAVAKPGSGAVAAGVDIASASTLPPLDSSAVKARASDPDEMLQRMRSFVLGRPSASARGMQTGADPAGPPPGGTSVKAKAFALEPRWSPSRSEFSEKLADALRDEAILHGIDLS